MRKLLLWLVASIWVLPVYGNEGKASVQIETYQLKNGLKVITKQVSSIPVVSVFVWYRVGARNELPGQSGLAHFLEHMLFKGTRHFPKGESTRLVDRTGGNQNGFTSNDYTAYYETLPAEHLELALRIEADRMQFATLAAKEIEQERTVILSELDGNLNQPETRLRNLTNAQTWVNHPYRRPVIGWREEVATLSIDQIRDYYHRYYCPQNATLVVVGDFQPAQLRRLIDRYYAPLASGRLLPNNQYPQEKQEGLRRVELCDHGPAGMVLINIPIPPAGNKDHFALSILNDTLTKGRSARLYKALVDTGLATRVAGSPMEMIDQGFWSFQATCQRGVQPAQVEEVIRREFKKIQQERVAPLEFQRCVNQTRAQLVYAKDSITDQATLLGYYQTVANDYSLLDQYPEEVAKVTPEALQSMAQKYLQPEQMTIGYFIPKQENVSGSGSGIAEAESRSQWKGKMPMACFAKPTPDRPVASVNNNAGYQKFVLRNGLTLLVQANPSNPMVALSGLIKGGITREPEDKPGIAIFHGQMLDRGSRKHSASQIAEALEFKGAELDFSCQAEELNISGEALSGDVELLLGMLAECLLEPAFPIEELERVRKQLLSQCHQARDNSSVRAWEGFNTLAYPAGHPMRRGLITAEAGIARLQQLDFIRYHTLAMKPEATILSISGDLSPAAVKNLVEQLFGGWAEGCDAKPWSPEPLPRMAEVEKSQKLVLGLNGKSEAIVVLGHQGLQRLDPEYYQATVANQVLGGGGFNSLLMQEVREKAGLTYSIYSQFRLSTGVRPWCLVMQTDPQHVEQAIELALAQVTRLQQGKVDRKSFEDAREQLVGSLALNMETNDGIAHLNREIEYHQLGGPRYRELYTQGIRSVTFEQMVAAAKKWLHPDKLIISIVEPMQDKKDVAPAK